jgi:CDP-diacylglycerol---serine O-phosphatidyltransferase
MEQRIFSIPQAFAEVPRRAGRRRLVPSMRPVAILPSLLTLGNVLSGFLAIFVASRPLEPNLPFGWSPLTFAALFIFMGMLLDGLDGQLARLARATSGLGEQLDSMADMVTFGVAPAFLAVQLAGIGSPFLSARSDRYFDRAALIIACCYVACAALRLARFNAELKSPAAEDHATFSGLPSPGAAGTVASLVLLHQHLLAQPVLRVWALNFAAYGILLVTLLTALAMISRMRYLHISNRLLRGRAPIEYVAVLVVVGLLLLIAPQLSLAAAFAAYAVSAPARVVVRLVYRRSGAATPSA